MKMALHLGVRGLGQVMPNPAVGCVIVRDGLVVGRGWTAPGGRPHGETEALARAGEAAQGATAYVSLEPCAHEGRTGACARALIDAGIRRVVGTCDDPDPRVSGQGYKMLEAAGVEVTTGVMAREAERLNGGFFSRVLRGRPYIILKLAASMDGRVATHTGGSRWITGPVSRTRGHMMRAQADAIMVGGTTAMMDNPDLKCRLPGLEERSPIRIVADGRLRLPLTSRLVRSAHEVPVWILTRKDCDAGRRAAFEDCGVTILPVPVTGESLMNMEEAMKILGGRGITRLLVEGGGYLAASLLIEKLVDRLVWFHGARLIGGDGVPALRPFGVDRLAMAPSLELLSSVGLDDDRMTSWLVHYEHEK